jgi:hypothetical protein
MGLAPPVSPGNRNVADVTIQALGPPNLIFH